MLIVNLKKRTEYLYKFSSSNNQLVEKSIDASWNNPCIVLVLLNASEKSNLFLPFLFLATETCNVLSNDVIPIISKHSMSFPTASLPIGQH